MKKTTKSLIFVLTLLSSFVFGQNGVTSYSIPFLPSVKNYINIDASSNKWICSSRGLIKFDGVNFTEFTTTNSTIPSNDVRAVAFDLSNNAWVATSSGLAKFDGTSWTTYNVMNSALPNDSVNTVYVNGTDVWAGTNHGLVKFDGTIWTVYNTSNSGILDNYIAAINMDSNGDLWVGTNFGLSILSGTSWLGYNATNSSLPSEKISSIYFINNQKWVSTAIDIFEFAFQDFYSLNDRYYFGLYNTSGLNMSNFVTSVNLTKGPQGGLLTSGMYEFIGNDVHQYSVPSGSFKAFENSNALVWSANSNTLFSFDYSNFQGQSQLNEPQGFQTLDINNVRASLSNLGDMHWDGVDQGGYEVPKNSGIHTVFSTGFWMGGIDGGGQLRQSAMTYRQNGYDYWPGPLDTITGNTDSVTSNAFNKIWKIDRLKIEEFQTMFANGSVQNGVYTVDPEIISWPAHGTGSFSRNLAPFVDVNANGVYDPLIGGDYPKIKGDQMCFWIFNDNMTHTETGGQPLGIEVHASAYAFACPDATVNDSANAINHTTFYNFKVFNRSINNYQQSALGLFVSGDLGGAYDDFVGCNSDDNYGFIYNGDNIDDNGGIGQLTYGTNPPMQSTVVLNGPLANPVDNIDNDNDGTIDEAGERCLMNSFMYYNNDNTVTGNPFGDQEYYNYLNARWIDSTQLTYGGDGHSSSLVPSNFMFDGIPAVSGWSETSIGNAPGDRRFLMGTNNFSFPANSNFDFDFAFVYTRDTTSVANYSIQHLYQRNKSDVQKVKHWFDSNQYPSCIEQTDNTCYAQFSISPDSVNSLNYFIFNSSSSGIQYTYLWDFGDGATSSIENPTHTYPGTGPYQLCLTVSDNLGCSSTYCDSLNAGRSGGGITINVVHTTGVNSIISKAANPIKIYPNPASSDLTIAYKPETKNAVVEIYNSIGQQVKQIALVDENQQITIADLTNGLYILKLNDGKNSATQRFVKQ